MRIQAVDVFSLYAALFRPFHWATGTAASRQANLVRVRLDSGVEGWGESIYDTSCILKGISLALVGEDVADRQRVARMLSNVVPLNDPISRELIGAVDVAIWDAVSRSAGVPLCRFISGMDPRAVDAYASSIYYTQGDESPALTARRWREAGFSGIKVKIGGRPLAEDLDRLRTIRAGVGPDVCLMVDANQSYDADSAIALAEALGPFDIYWIEEPVPALDLDAHRALKTAARFRLAAGEGLHSFDAFLPFLAEDLLDVVQFNVSRVGGVVAALDIAKAAAGKQLAIHHWGTPVGLAASLHLACCLPIGSRILMEVDLSPNPLRGIWDWPGNGTLRDSQIAPPSGSGLGIAPDIERLSFYAIG